MKVSLNNVARKLCTGEWDIDYILCVALTELGRQLDKDEERLTATYGTSFIESIERLKDGNPIEQ